MRRLIVAAVLSLALVGQAGADGEKIRVSKEVWAIFQQYAGTIGSTKKGAFAVTSDGTGAGSGVCEEIKCEGLAKDVALKSCKKHNPNADCIIFAVDDDIKVEYEVAQ